MNNPLIERLVKAVESLAESQLRIEKDTKDTNKQLIQIAKANAELLKNSNQKWELPKYG